VSVTDLWIFMPLLIISCGAVLTLLFGAIFPGRVSVVIAVAALLGAALWSLQTPPMLAAPQLGIVATPLARLFTVVFCLLGAAVLLISVNYNEWRSVSGEEYPATVLFAVFGMTALAAATNLLILFLGLEAMTFGFYILVAIDLKNVRSGEAGLKYLLLGAVSAAFPFPRIALGLPGGPPFLCAGCHSRLYRPTCGASCMAPACPAGYPHRRE